MTKAFEIEVYEFRKPENKDLNPEDHEEINQIKENSGQFFKKPGGSPEKFCRQINRPPKKAVFYKLHIFL